MFRFVLVAVAACALPLGLAAQAPLAAVPEAAPAPAPVPAPAAPVPNEVVVAAAALRPGEFHWAPDAVPAGPVLIVVSLTDQKLYAYRGGALFAVSTVSTGKPGHATPRGAFPILGKHREHYSNLYNNAPMPFMQRLTNDGIALHAGRLPGYPASHGCVRLPLDFAKRLFGVTERGGMVVVTDRALDGLTAATAPFDAGTGRPIPELAV